MHAVLWWYCAYNALWCNYSIAQTFEGENIHEFVVLEPPVKVFSTKFGHAIPTNDRLLALCKSFLCKMVTSFKVSCHIYVINFINSYCCTRKKIHNTTTECMAKQNIYNGLIIIVCKSTVNHEFISHLRPCQKKKKH